MLDVIALLGVEKGVVKRNAMLESLGPAFGVWRSLRKSANIASWSREGTSEVNVKSSHMQSTYIVT